MSKLKITGIKPIDQFSYLNAFSIDYLDKRGNKCVWEMISRSGEDRLREEIFNDRSYSDGVMIFATDVDKNNVIMLREYRIVAGKYVYTLPAGLCEEDEDISNAAIREFKEETGMDLKVECVYPERYISVGMSNEKSNTVFGYYSGTASNQYQEDNEDAQIVVVDRQMAKNILKNEEVVIRSAMLLEHFFRLNPFFDDCK